MSWKTDLRSTPENWVVRRSVGMHDRVQQQASAAATTTTTIRIANPATSVAGSDRAGAGEESISWAAAPAVVRGGDGTSYGGSPALLIGTPTTGSSTTSLSSEIGHQRRQMSPPGIGEPASEHQPLVRWTSGAFFDSSAFMK